jgi:hypothetical protein
MSSGDAYVTLGAATAAFFLYVLTRRPGLAVLVPAAAGGVLVSAPALASGDMLLLMGLLCIAFVLLLISSGIGTYLGSLARSCDSTKKHGRMSEKREARREHWPFGRVVFAIFCILALFSFLWFLGMQFVEMKQTVQSRSWRAVEGLVTESKVSKSAFLWASSCSVRITYTYTASGREYSGHRVRFGDKSFGIIAPESCPTVYGLGGKVIVYYDPEEPEEAVLVREYSWKWWRILSEQG